MNTIIVETIPHEQQRYDTCGDYWQTDYGRSYLFKISRMRDWRCEAAVFLHEFIEAMWCKEHGVSIAAIDAWDLAHPEADEPGEVPGCPYFVGHALATEHEKSFVGSLGLSWEEHEEIVDAATAAWVGSGRSAGEAGGVRAGGAGLSAHPDRGLSDQASGDSARPGDREVKDGAA